MKQPLFVLGIKAIHIGRNRALIAFYDGKTFILRLGWTPIYDRASYTGYSRRAWVIQGRLR